jgi:hypothetical protein
LDEVLFEVVLDGQIEGAVPGVAGSVAAALGLKGGMGHSIHILARLELVPFTQGVWEA